MKKVLILGRQVTWTAQGGGLDNSYSDVVDTLTYLAKNKELSQNGKGAQRKQVHKTKTKITEYFEPAMSKNVEKFIMECDK